MVDGIESLWKTYGSLVADDVPGDVRLAGSLCILDWFGVTLAGSREPLARILQESFADDGEQATIIGTALRATPRTAALINGATGHALDYDDTNLIGGLHGTAAVLPAALAIAEAQDSSGAELLAAYLVGIEICSRLRFAVGERHYRAGWHITSTLGIFGATAAASRLLGLDGEQFGRAMGIAASQASGIHANFGTMTKPFHAGHAAERGLVSATIAARGFTASPEGFERVMAQMAGDLDWGKLDDLDGTWVVADTLFKNYASCAGTQATIEATKRLVAAGLSPTDILGATVHVPESVTQVCTVQVPHTGLQAKFSLPGVIALTMFGQNLSSPAAFDTEFINRDEVQDVAARVQVVADPGIDSNSALIDVDTPSGARQGAFHFNRSAPNGHDVEGQLAAKFAALTEPLVGSDADILRGHLLDLESAPPVRSLCGLATVG